MVTTSRSMHADSYQPWLAMGQEYYEIVLPVLVTPPSIMYGALVGAGSLEIAPNLPSGIREVLRVDKP